MPAKHNVVWLFSICPELISRASQYFGFPMLLITVEGPKVPLSGGLFEFVAPRFYADDQSVLDLLTH
jgi:hypothetical protein